MKNTIKNCTLFALIFLFGSIITMDAQSKLKQTKTKRNLVVVTEAEYPGGFEALGKFISDQLSYPSNMLAAKTQGKVEVEFVIDKEGKIGQVKIIKSAGKEFDQEAIRVVKLMGAWKPATQNREKVSSYYTLPIIFSLER
jgi:TonB family protein